MAPRLLFLEYISDAFEERHAYLERAVNDPKDEYYVAPATPNLSGAVTRLFEDPERRAQRFAFDDTSDTHYLFVRWMAFS